MTQIPRADKGMTCPLHQKDMSSVCHKCPWWQQIKGKHPQSEEIIDRWACSIALLPMLLIEGAQMSRQTGAAVESFRNEMVKASQQPVQIVVPQVPSQMPQHQLSNIGGRS